MNRIEMNFVRLFKFFNLSIIFTIFTVAAVFVLVDVSNVPAQKRKTPRKTVNKEKEPFRIKIIESFGKLCIPPPDSDYFSVLQIDKNSRLTLATEKNGSTEVLFSAVPMSALSKVLLSIDKKSVITFKADPALNFGLVVKTLSDIRQTADACVNIEASTKTEDQYVYFMPEPRPTNEAPIPNPLTLVVNLDKNMNLTLNNEPLGTLADTTRLKNFLKEILKERENNGLFREGTNEIEATVFVQASPTGKFGDVIKVVDAVKEAGAFPIGLQIDDLDNIILPFQFEQKP